MLAAVAGCSSGSDQSPQLVTISVQAARAKLPLGGDYPFTALGVYSDGSSVNISTSVAWKSSDTSVATISNSAGKSGLATSVSAGITTISATLGSVSGTYSISVVPVGGTSQGTALVLTGAISTIAGSAALLNLPVGITTDGRNLYVADSNNNKIRKIEILTGAVTTLAGSGQLGTVDGAGSEAWFYHPRGITTDGTCLYVAEMESNKIRKIDISSGAVSTLASVNSPAGITTDGSNLFVTNFLSHTISRIVISSGVVATLAGSPGIPGSLDGAGAAATFNQPVGITTDGLNLYLNDFGSGLIRRVVIASGDVSTLAGGFTNPATGITTAGTNLYVADYGNTVRKITLSGGVVTQLAGASALFNHPEGLASDGKSIFISDSGSNTIRMMN